MAHLWSPFTLGGKPLPHRLAMAAMTRGRALADGTPHPDAAIYYGQRAGLGLLIAEGTQPSADGQGYLSTPGIYTDAHVAGWKRVADAVHARKALLFIQLMHVGRMGHPENTPHHRQMLAPSAIAAGVDIFTAEGMKPAPIPREMSSGDIRQTIGDFAFAARRAIDAGADGVEIHAANGYLLHQFLAANANRRDDDFGGDSLRRVRLPLEVAEAVADAIGPQRVGMRISPGLKIGGIAEGKETPHLYRHLVRGLSRLQLAYLHVTHAGDEDLLASLRQDWHGPLVVNRPGRARSAIGDDVATGVADMVSVGRMALANPDLVDRLKSKLPLNDGDPSTFYGGGARGYIDYPMMEAAAAESA
ncbi:MAG: alkene reductase [Alphaproteobacteria bacterium]|nr:alkene reductase [Alphaproteobacteria bacterium]